MSSQVLVVKVVVLSSHVSQVVVAVARSIQSSSHMVVVSSNSWRVRPAEVGVASVDTQEAKHPQEKEGVMAVEGWGI